MNRKQVARTRLTEQGSIRNYHCRYTTVLERVHAILDLVTI